MRLINRGRAAELGNETIKILDNGTYTSQAGKRVELKELIATAVAGTCSYPPDEEISAPLVQEQKTIIEVIDETTLSAARRLAEAGENPVALNFASAKNPGGGFLSGARAQEESLARSSALYACLQGNDMYQFHRNRRDPMYTNYAIYSPDVPVFRDDTGLLLEEPYLCSFITAPAVNAKVVLDRHPRKHDEIHKAMSERIGKVLEIADLKGHKTLILGAWGCGAFGNDRQKIAELFALAVNEDFKDVFSKVVFAIMDYSKNNKSINIFAKALGLPRV